ncbi:MAG: arginine--tRNA ligase [Bacteroidetes bacterium]|nr:arginine--tRNA ligase [Bacteroidota bacterium]
MIVTLLLEKTVEAVKELYGYSVEPDKINLEKTSKEFEGDYTIVVFPLLRISRKSPEITGKEIGDFLKQSFDYIESYTVIKGFLNILLSDRYWINLFLENYNKQDYGRSEPIEDAPVIIEFSSPNTNKPLHLGHIRNNLLGYAVASILEANGNKVIRMNLVNDRGIHICKSMLAYIKWGNGEDPSTSGIKGDSLVGKYYVRFNEEYKKEINELILKGYSQEEAEKRAPVLLEAQEILRKWESGDPGTIQLWRKMNGWVYKGFEKTYARLGITFDHVQFESETYLLGKELVKEGLEKGVLAQKPDGSIWADLTNDGFDEKVLQRSDGTSVYITQDIGTAQQRYDHYHPSRMIYVVGNEQNYHFDVLKSILKKLGRNWADLIFHLSYGMVELPSGKMKSREGTVVDADDLMDEMCETAGKITTELGKAKDLPDPEAGELFNSIGLAALKFFILKVSPKKNMTFDPVESIDFNGNTGPFVQYTFARIRSLLKKSGIPVSEINMDGDENSLVLMKSERELLKYLALFPEVIRDAANDLNPSFVTNFCYETAKFFNQFYQEVPVLKESDQAKRLFRLCLSMFTGNTLKSGMSMLGITLPDQM